MNAEEIREKLEECPIPWKLRSPSSNTYQLDCGGNISALFILTREMNIGSSELAAIIDMIEMAPTYIETLLAEIEDLKESLAYELDRSARDSKRM